jgi:hypothetical protein
MKMTDLLSNLPHQLQKIIETDVSIAHFLQGGMTLSETLLSESTLDELFKQLKPWEQKTLRLIVQRFATHLFDFNSLQIAARATELSGAELKAGIAQLRRKGILFAIRKSWGENSYFIPSDLLGIWQKLLMNSVRIYEQEDHKITLASKEYRGLAFDLLFMLSYISFNEINLTKKRALPKRHLQNLAEMICLDDARITHFQISEAALDFSDVPKVSVLMAFAKKLELIEYGPTRVTLRQSKVHNWLQLSNNEMNCRLYVIFSEIFVSDLPAMKHFNTKIETLSSKRWYLIEDIVHWLQEYDIMITFTDWLGLLTSFGFIESGFNTQGQAVLRWNISINESMDMTTLAGKFYVQSDYEVLVPPDVSFSIRWELACVADHMLTEQVGIYRITEKSVHRALLNGRSAEDCINFLNRCSFFEIPDHLISAIKHWARCHEDVFLKPIMSDLVDVDDSRLIKQESIEFYNIESTLMSRSDIYPLWQEIPSLWWKECRQYHGSTRKEIIKQAISWQTSLKLRNVNKEWVLIPESLQECELGWSLAGTIQAREVVISSDQWQEMQLILPGFYELDG